LLTQQVKGDWRVKITRVEQDPKASVGHVGLALISEMARVSGLNDLCQELTTLKQPQISDAELLRTLCGLLCQGKTDFDHVKAFRDDAFFLEALELRRVPSAEILRQRFQGLALAGSLFDHLPECSAQLWEKAGMEPEYLVFGDQRWVRMDVDVAVFDNADTKKEGASFTYNNRFGFAPIFAHLGGGWMVGAQLRPGSAHSLAEGTIGFFLESVDRALAMVQEAPIVVVADSGFDSRELIHGLHEKKRTDFVIKHNLRKETKESWLETAREHARDVRPLERKKESGTIYRGSVTRVVKGIQEPVRMVFEVTEVTRQKGQQLLVPEIRVCVLWTSLDLPEEDVLKIYRDRGTSEQYHAEFKSELDMERLPSGKFAVNNAFLLLGMLVYNMLKVVGRDMVFARALGLKKATRRRMKTVMRSVMLMCGRIVRHARQLTLRLNCTGPWYAFFSGLLGRLQAA
jgi:hypothetical protein